MGNKPQALPKLGFAVHNPIKARALTGSRLQPRGV